MMPRENFKFTLSTWQPSRKSMPLSLCSVKIRELNFRPNVGPVLISEPITMTRPWFSRPGCQNMGHEVWSAPLKSCGLRVGEEWENWGVVDDGKYIGQATKQQMSVSTGSPFSLEEKILYHLSLNLITSSPTSDPHFIPLSCPGHLS